MRLVYVLIGDHDPRSGVGKKVLAQISTLKTAGVDAELVFISIGNVELPPCNFIKIIRIDPVPVKNLVGRIKRVLKIRLVFSDIIKSLGSDDILYYRYSHSLPLFYPLNYLKKLRTCKIVTEHQTIEMTEFRLNNIYPEILSDGIFGGFLRQQSDAIIGVTSEITEYEIFRTKKPGIPHITIGNGIDVRSCPVRTTHPWSDGNQIDLLCVAGFSRWHGIDRLLEGIAGYRGPVKVILHMVGTGSELPALKKTVADLKIFNEVVFHGFKTGRDIDVLFDTCHIAVGSLGLHRIGLNEASILKAREYCARGIPYVIACADPDFPDDFPYIHRVPPDESPVEIEKIIEFAQRLCAELDHPQKMRAYASQHLDWSVKMKQLKAFLETAL